MNAAVQIRKPGTDILTLHHALTVAQSYGVSSLRQLQVFLEIAESPGSTLDDLAGCTPEDPTNRAYAGIIRKLSVEGYRGHDGLDLVMPAGPDESRPKASRLALTSRGRRLYREILK